MNSKYPKTRCNLVAVVCTTFAMGLALSANAAEFTGPDVTVRYDSPALDTAQGASQLLKRIESAAGRICARLDHGSLASRANAQTCSRNVTADAVRKVNHPMLLAAYDAAAGVAPPVARVTK